jgi:NAD(P)-dependent dehydrogenase (short-subunit alcohol dehydrogenase family)
MNDFQVKKLIDHIPDDIDILVNNVGVFRGKEFKDETVEDWNDHFKVNLMSGVQLSKHFLPEMIKRDWGRIIFISSECATLVPSDLLSYSVSKASINVFSSGLAKLTKGTNVTVNTIVPGSTLSEGSKKFLEETASRENKTKEEVEKNFFNEVRNSSLISRFLSVTEVANTIFYTSRVH